MSNAHCNTPSHRPIVLHAVVVALVLVVALLALLAPPAAASGTPAWHVEAEAPTYFRPGHGGTFVVSVTDEGTGPASELTVKYRLPPGMELVGASTKLPPHVQSFEPVVVHWTGQGVPSLISGFDLAKGLFNVCSASTATEVDCSMKLEGSPLGLEDRRVGGSGKIEPGQTVTLLIGVWAPSSAAEGPIVNRATAEGGGAPPVTAQSGSTVSSHPRFEITETALQTTEALPVPVGLRSWGFVNRPVAFTQAGGHPEALTASIDFATEDYLTNLREYQDEEGFWPVPTDSAKDVYVTLPVGLLGNPAAVPQCPLKQALSFGGSCPASTQVGIAVTSLLGAKEFVGPIYNVTPEAGQSAEFLLANETKVNFLLTAHVVRVVNPVTGREEYGLAVISRGDPTVQLRGVETTFWGDPASSVHDSQRGLLCGKLAIWGEWRCQGGGEPSGEPEVPFLTWPSDCAAGSERMLVSSDSWEAPGVYAPATASIPGVTGCGLLQFDPGVEVSADTLQADAPVGLGVALNVPQFEEPQRLATPEMRRSVITLPAGMSVNPGIVDGIEACNATGPEGINIEGPEAEYVNPVNGEVQLAPGKCPDRSIVGTAEAETPLLRVPVRGHVYLARPGCGNPALGQAPCTEQDVADGNLYQLYLELGGTGALADTGVNIKVRLKTDVNPATGQLTSVAEEIAQLPFSKLVVKLNGGPRAPLANPPMCGSAVTSADFSTWAAPGTVDEPGGPNNGVFMPGLPDVTPSSLFNVDLAGDGEPTSCPGLPFAPGFVAGTVTASAGKFSAFTLNLGRKDREQYVKGIQVHTPPGLLGVLASVSLCGEAQANAGTCPEASRIGTTRVASGAGSHPFEIEGDMYLTGPHDGAPFGLSVVTNVVAGPFHLGKVVVRARIDIDPHDSSLTVTTDETGPYALPQIVFGVPLRLQRITVNVDRPGFMFNPTSCRAQQITAKISGSGQALASVASPFAVGACRSLAFKPAFRVSTNGHTSRKLGASLDTKLSYPKGALGRDANIAYVKVSLPRQLPSFLTTLQNACLDSTFERDPAQCPTGSIVGIARTRTPLLPVGLQGPVYFVSHGGAKFPDLVIVLQGDGIRVDLIGNTFISNGVTSSTFKTVPDVPVDSFELYLPQGKNHALAANGNLCRERRKLVMPTLFVAQNGMRVTQKTKIVVTGCGKARARRSGHRHGRGAQAPHANGPKGRR